jgi:hypothetical protein
MSQEDFEVFRATTEAEDDAYRDESEFRKWCKESNEDPLDEGARESYKEYKDEYAPENFNEEELTRRMDDLDRD